MSLAPFPPNELPFATVVVPSDPLRDVKRFEATRDALRDAVTSEAPLSRRARQHRRRRALWRRRSG